MRKSFLYAFLGIFLLSFMSVNIFCMKRKRKDRSRRESRKKQKVLTDDSRVSFFEQEGLHFEQIECSRKFDSAYKTFWDWEKACSKLLTFPQWCQIKKKPSEKNPWKNANLKKEEFESMANAFVDSFKNSAFGNSDCWIDGKGPDVLLKEKQRNTYYGQKICVDSNCIFSVHADLHSDIQSLLAYLKELASKAILKKEDPFKISDSRYHLVFLGDYSDRSFYGAEVLYTVMRLKVENPDNVTLLRGNHECLLMNKHKAMGVTGFGFELVSRFGYKKNSDFDLIGKVYQVLPSVVLMGVGNSFDIFCHGGLDLDFDLRHLLNAKSDCVFQLMRFGNRQNGFISHDFIVGDEETRIIESKGKRTVIGKPLVKELFERWNIGPNKIRCVHTGHQHNHGKGVHGSMIEKLKQHGGIYNSWSGTQWSGKRGEVLKLDQKNPVWTLGASPCSSIGYSLKYNYSTYALLKMGVNLEDWALQPNKIEMFSCNVS